VSLFYYSATSNRAVVQDEYNLISSSEVDSYFDLVGNQLYRTPQDKTASNSKYAL